MKYIKNIKRVGIVYLIICMVLSYDINVMAADDGQVKTSISASSNSIYENESATISLTLKGVPYEGKEEPNDVVLVIDRSSSMSDAEMVDMKAAAINFVSKIDFAVHRVAVVAYDNNIESIPFSVNTNEINTFINTITPRGTTAIGDAINEACNILNNKRADAYGSIILMTDGVNTAGTEPLPVAEAAKSKGYFFYTVSLAKSQESDNNLKKMATSEADHYSVFASSGLSQAYNDIAEKIGYCNAKDVVVTQQIGDNFEIVAGSTANNIPQPTISGNVLTWKMNQLGKGNTNLSYQIKPKKGISEGIYQHGTGQVMYTNYLGEQRTITINSNNITIKHCPPEILTVSPTASKSGSGDKITLTGNYFRTGANVTVGGVAVNDCVISGNMITFSMPVVGQGGTSIRVKNTDGQSDRIDFMVLSDPQISNVSPNSTEENTKKRIEITGSGFVGTYSTLKVYVGDEEAVVISTTSTKIVAKVPAKEQGVYDIKVVNQDGVELVLPNAFTYTPKSLPDPVIIDTVSPNNGVENEKHEVTITGTNFIGSYSSVKVYVDDAPATVISVTNQNTIKCKVPKKEAGTYDIKVVNANGVSATKVAAFTYTPEDPNKDAPVINRLSPASSAEKKKNTVVITGEKFVGTYSTIKVKVGGKEATVISVTSQNTIKCKFPSMPAGVYDVEIICANGKSIIMDAAYEYVAVVVDDMPDIYTLTPDNSVEGAKQAVTIQGKNYVGTYSTIKVKVGGKEATVISVDSTTIKCKFPSMPTGTYDVEVICANGKSIIKPQCYKYNVKPQPATPIISNITPDNGEEKKSSTITIQGSNFEGTYSTVQVLIGTENATVISVTDTTIKCKTPKLDVGTYDVKVVCTNGVGMLQSAYTYNSPIPKGGPTVTGLSVNNGTAGAKVKNVVITGSDFVGTYSTIKVLVGGESATVISVLPTMIKCHFPKLSAGTYDLTIINADNTTVTVQNAFTYN